MRGYVLRFKIWMPHNSRIKDLFIYIFHHVDAQGEKINNICVLEYLVKGSAEDYSSKLSLVAMRKIKRNLSSLLKGPLLKEPKASKLGRKRQKKHCSNLHERLVGF